MKINYNFLKLCTSLIVIIQISSTESRRNLPPKIREEIKNYKGVVQNIVDYTVFGAGRGRTFDRLANLTDTYGPRLTGSQDLEIAIDGALNLLQSEGFENVHGEQVTVPHWVRGEAYASFIIPRTPVPRTYQLAVLALGLSIGTPKGGIKAEAIVVRSWEDLAAKGRSEVAGKIVVYNVPYINYSITVDYRARGASEAAKLGAVAALVRSITPYSIYSLHTGMQGYESGIPQIPVACITVEDSHMLQRFQDRGQRIQIELYMNCSFYPDTISRNTVAEIRGREYPDQTVLFGGHFDSWDVGQGAMDDGGGFMIVWEAMSVIKTLGLPKPRRTIRSIFWTAEEVGGFGATEYYKRHKDELSSMSLVMESDMGTFLPYGLGFTGSGLARAVMEEILTLLQSINTTSIIEGGGSSDTGIWTDAGIPSATLYNANQHYFNFHHSNGDTVDVEDPHVLDLCTALWTSVAYVVADLSDMLPRTGDYPTTNDTILYFISGKT